MIYELGLPAEDLSRISAFIGSDGASDIPELTDMGEKVLDRVTRPQKGLWHVIVGRFVEYEHLDETSYLTPDGEHVTYADAMMDEKGNSLVRWGQVVQDYDSATDAYQVGVPI
jgi:hypothetical protein